MSLKPSIAFHTLGCRLNQAETAALQQAFETAGFSVCDLGDGADVVVVNTCTVTANGDADTRRLVGRIHRNHPQARIALIGCQAQLQAEDLAQYPGVHWVVGTTRKMDLPLLIADDPNGAEPRIVVEEIPRGAFRMPAAGIDRQHTRANLKVQDGCDFYCSYCEIPYARGHARSREFDDILQEARILIASGHREIILTGINVGLYRHEGHRFPDVVAALLELPGLGRLRISSIEPTTIGVEILDLMRAKPRLCRHLHIPLQSGCDATLQRMRRRYTTAEYAEFLRLAHASIPGLNLGTDIMVGFPGESMDEFEATHAFLSSLPYAYFHVFSYSDRKNAKARTLDVPRVEPSEIHRRSDLLHQLGNAKRQAFMTPQLGQTVIVLAEQKKRGLWSGLTDTFLRVQFPAEGDCSNQFVLVRLETAAAQSLTGTYLGLASG